MNLDHIHSMRHSPVRNYAIPGLTSWLIGPPPTPEHGCVRLFECSRDHHEQIVPHSHRFDFQCLVLAGSVLNILWEESEDGDLFVPSALTYDRGVGKYLPPERLPSRRLAARHHEHHEGDWYGMTHDQIHSIQFARGSRVLFFEGPTLTKSSTIIEPYVEGKWIPTFEVKPWMFQREQQK